MKISMTTLFLVGTLIAISCDSKSTNSGGGGQRVLGLIIGDMEGMSSAGCTAITLAKANSITFTSPIFPSDSFRFDSLMDTNGTVTSVAFVIDSGGESMQVVCDFSITNNLEREMITSNGPDLYKPWHLEGLAASAPYTITFIGGGLASPRRSMRMYVDVDGSGTLDSTEVEDFIGLDGVIETRSVAIKASRRGEIRGEFWGGSTNMAGENGSWRGWSIKSAP